MRARGCWRRPSRARIERWRGRSRCGIWRRPHLFLRRALVTNGPISPTPLSRAMPVNGFRLRFPARPRSPPWAPTNGARAPRHAAMALRRVLEVEAPAHFTAPSGSSSRSITRRKSGPKIAIRVQELFGLDRHPAVAAGRIPLVIELLSPGESTGAGDARSSPLLARHLCGGQGGDERPLSAPSLARRSAHCGADGPRAKRAPVTSANLKHQAFS